VEADLQASESYVAGCPHEATRSILLPIDGSKRSHCSHAVAAALTKFSPADTPIRRASIVNRKPLLGQGMPKLGSVGAGWEIMPQSLDYLW
jgi:hypothetical protein